MKSFPSIGFWGDHTKCRRQKQDIDLPEEIELKDFDIVEDRTVIIRHRYNQIIRFLKSKYD